VINVYKLKNSYQYLVSHAKKWCVVVDFLGNYDSLVEKEFNNGSSFRFATKYTYVNLKINLDKDEVRNTVKKDVGMELEELASKWKPYINISSIQL
jgi:hypothetical protein